MTEDPRISEIRAVLDAPRDPFDDGGEKLACIRAILDRPAPLDVVRVFRYTKPGGPVYRAYPDGRVTRDAETIDPSNLVHCVASVAAGAMTETAEPQPGSETERVAVCAVSTTPRVWVHGDEGNPERISPREAAETGVGLRNDTGHIWHYRNGGWQLDGKRPEQLGRDTRWGFWGLLEHCGRLTEVS